jgi:hypothetical protein
LAVVQDSNLHKEKVRQCEQTAVHWQEDYIMNAI